MQTDRDYADMVNPYVRAEEEAEQRGFRKGVLMAVWWLLCICVAGLLLVSLKANAVAPWSYEESRQPIKASERDARITVCQSNSVLWGWSCFIVR